MKKITLSLIAIMLAFNFSFAGGGKKHHFGVFVGPTSNFHTEHTDFTLGADYEFHVNKYFGVGVIADFVFADHSETLLMSGLFFHPFGSFKINIGNGIAIAEAVDHSDSHSTETDDHHDSHGHHVELLTGGSSEGAETSGSETHYVFRAGVGYDFHVGSLTLTPIVNLDVINGHNALAYGITFGYGF